MKMLRFLSAILAATLVVAVSVVAAGATGEADRPIPRQLAAKREAARAAQISGEARAQAWIPERQRVARGEPARPTPEPKLRPTEITVTPLGMHQSALSLATVPTPAGEPRRIVQPALQLADGLNYRDERGQWQPTEPVFEIVADHFVARRGPHKVILGPVLDAGAVDFETPDGVRLVSAPLALAYFDPESGRSATLAVARRVRGHLVAPNQVLYPDAFAGPRASVLYTYERHGFRQDVLLHETPLAPGRFGLPEAVRLELLTEFEADTPEPRKTRRILGGEADPGRGPRMAEPEAVDEELAWGGEMRMGCGHAFALNAGEAGARLPVAKAFRRIEGRPVLIEAVEYPALKTELGRLRPGRTAAVTPDSEAATSVPSAAGAVRRLPVRPGLETAQAGSPASGKADFAAWLREPAVVLDYEHELSGTRSNFTFTNGVTYLIVGPATFNGTTTLEGGTVVKYRRLQPNGSPANARVTLNGPVVCRTGPYQPAVFTAEDDDSVGVILHPELPAADPRGADYAATALVIARPDSTLQHLRISHAVEAIRYEHAWQQNTYGETLRHVQIVHCAKGLVGRGELYYGTYYWKKLYAGNVLMHQVGTAVSGRYYQATVEQATVRDCDHLVQADTGVAAYSTLTFRNGLLAEVRNLYSPAGGTVSLGSSGWNGFFNPAPGFAFGSQPVIETQANPFQPVAQGLHYLAATHPFRARGTTGIQATTLADLKTRTTQLPVSLSYPFSITEATVWAPKVARYQGGNPDLGYHYAPIDFLVAGVSVQDTTLEVRPGTVVAVPATWLTGYGLMLENGASLRSVGRPTALTRVVGADTVQEAYNQDGPRIFRWDAEHNPYPGVACIVVDFEGASGPSYPGLECRFTDFAVLGGGPRYHAVLGEDEYGWPGAWAFGSFSDMEFRDCQFQGGRLMLAQWQSLSAGPVVFCNNLLERVQTILGFEHDTTMEAYNNLFRGGELTLKAPADPSTWAIRDNLFDRLSGLWQYGLLDTDPETEDDYNAADHNAYCLEPGVARLQPPGIHDAPLIPHSAPPTYLTGPLGRYYCPPSGVLYNGGSRGPEAAALMHHTTRVDQIKEWDEPDDPDHRRVNIGFHYVAVAANQPKDTDADGLPDYYELELDTAWESSDSDADGVPDGAADADGDGVCNRDEFRFGSDPVDSHDDTDLDGVSNTLEAFYATNPLVADNPLSIVGWSEGATLPPGNVQVVVRLAGGFSAESLFVALDETVFEPEDSIDFPRTGDCSIGVDTARLRNGTHTMHAGGTIRRTSSDGAPLAQLCSAKVTTHTLNEITFAGLGEGERSSAWELWEWDDTFGTAFCVRAVLQHYPAECYLEVFNDEDERLYSASTPFHSPFGRIDWEWDMISNQGGLYEPPPGSSCYAVITTYWPDEAAFRAGAPGSGTSGPIRTPNSEYLPIPSYGAGERGAWIIAAQAKDADGAVEMEMNTLVAAWEENRSGSALFPPVLPEPVEGSPSPGQRAFEHVLSLPIASDEQSAREDRTRLEAGYHAIRQVIRRPHARNFWYYGHGDSQMIGGDHQILGAGAVALRGSKARLSRREDVLAVLKADKRESRPPHAYRFVFLDSCNSATFKGWCEAFNISAKQFKTDPKCMQYYFDDPAGPPRRMLSAFCGWDRKKEYLVNVSVGDVSPQWGEYRRVWRDAWLSNKMLYEAHEAASQACIRSDPEPERGKSWGAGMRIFGYRLLRWDETNSGF